MAWGNEELARLFSEMAELLVLTGETGFRVIVGGGLGRTPMVGHVVSEFVPWPHLLSYLEAILRVYNRYGRRDNKYKARIKILVKDRTPAVFAREVAAEWAHLRDGPSTVTAAELERIRDRFTRPTYRTLPATDTGPSITTTSARAAVCV